MDIQFEIDNKALSKVIDILQDGGARADTAQIACVKRNTENTKKYAQMLVPKDTRTLKNNIKTRYEDEGQTGIVYVDLTIAYYGYWVESGTKRMGARPYLEPAWNKYASTFKADLATSWAKSLFK